MTSFLLLSSDSNVHEAYLTPFLKQYAIDPIDVTRINKETSVKQTTHNLGIDDVKFMQKKLFLKPIKSKTKAVIIETAERLTTEAQNALLKVLEEPPADTIIVLLADTREAMLPTIISRCQIIELNTEGKKLTEKKRAEYSDFIASLPTLSVGECLKKAELLAKDKEKAIVWTKNCIIVVREKLLSEILNDTAIDFRSQISMLNALQSLHTLLKTTNVNPRFAIENTLLAMHK